MNQIVDRFEVPVMHPDRFFIDGRWTTASTERQFTLINPATLEITAKIAEAVEFDIQSAVAAARKAFDEGPWPRMSPLERSRYMLRMVDYFKEKHLALSHAWTQQIGAPFAWASATTSAAIGFFSFYAGLAEDFCWEETRPTNFPGHHGLLVREPVGVVAAIIPWNAPFFTLVNKLAPALMAGCTVIVKPSPETPIEAYIVAEAAEAVGLPAGVLNVVTADRQVSECLVRDSRVDKVSFTGSSSVGKRIASICGERVARVTLELGGKSAAILLDDYDMELAAEQLAASSCQLCGQVCANLTRFLVPFAAHDKFVASLATRLKALRVGDPYDSETQMGPIAMKRQLERVERYIAIGEAEGANLVCGGKRPAQLQTGYYIEPTLFARVDNSSTIAREEIFGPVFCVTPYESLSDAIRLANDSVFGLSGAVFTNDPEKASIVARAVRTGTMGQNGSRTDFSIGFGGFKESGIGREGGVEGILPYLESKTMILKSSPLR